MASVQLVCSLATMVVTVDAWLCGRLDKVVAEVMRQVNWRVELEFLPLLCLMIKTALMMDLRMVTTVLVLQCSLRVHSQQLTAQQIMSCSPLVVDSYVSGLDHHVGHL